MLGVTPSPDDQPHRALAQLHCSDAVSGVADFLYVVGTQTRVGRIVAAVNVAANLKVQHPPYSIYLPEHLVRVAVCDLLADMI